MKRVVLCRPQGPRNVGSALRAVENLGPADLYLVRPERPALLEHPEFEQMAHGVEDFENKVHVVDSLEEALEECTDSVGFTARARHHRIVQPLRAVQSELEAQCAQPDRRVALVFGSEVSGLDETETDLCQRLVYLELTGAHDRVACSGCHPTGTLPDGRTGILYAPVPVRCEECHATPPPPLDGDRS